MPTPFARALACACACALLPTLTLAGVPRDLPLPSGTPSADQIIEQVYYVNHFLP